ncbi:hypothetical protein B0J12DRAFT_58159 [Macrophomina phaseolina]|uniref:Uncharacterized protein n=1 Tax=Macrophomina phaseolina TaxID=35725 RepID=A0ABQ8GEW8_9PEZI|nr:hypothetical protein B0J12DRAFT_58159 [Macrophomina phaseolina]
MSRLYARLTGSLRAAKLACVSHSQSLPVFPSRRADWSHLARSRAPRLSRPSIKSPVCVPDRLSRRGLNEFSRSGLNKVFAVGGLEALTGFAPRVYNTLALTSSQKKWLPCAFAAFLAISEPVQAQGCPVVRLGRVHIGWLDRASVGPGCEPGSRTSVSFRLPFPSMGLPGWMVALPKRRQ